VNDFYTSMETKRALREIMLSIIETNLLESNNVDLQNQFVEKFLTSFQKKIYFSNGIYVELYDDNVIILLILNVYNPETMLNDLFQLQKQIVKDVEQLTGIKIKAINIKVKNIL
jgi:uncharacterized alkaline shock family protein YloU